MLLARWKHPGDSGSGATLVQAIFESCDQLDALLRRLNLRKELSRNSSAGMELSCPRPDRPAAPALAHVRHQAFLLRRWLSLNLHIRRNGRGICPASSGT